MFSDGNGKPKKLDSSSGEKAGAVTVGPMYLPAGSKSGQAKATLLLPQPLLIWAPPEGAAHYGRDPAPTVNPSRISGQITLLLHHPAHRGS